MATENCTLLLLFLPAAVRLNVRDRIRPLLIFLPRMGRLKTIFLIDSLAIWAELDQFEIVTKPISKTEVAWNDYQKRGSTVFSRALLIRLLSVAIMNALIIGPLSLQAHRPLISHLMVNSAWPIKLIIVGWDMRSMVENSKCWWDIGLMFGSGGVGYFGGKHIRNSEGFFILSFF